MRSGFCEDWREVGQLTTDEMPVLVAMKPLLPSSSQRVMTPCACERGQDKNLKLHVTRMHSHPP
jgi:hypothetical protein